MKLLLTVANATSSVLLCFCASVPHQTRPSSLKLSLSPTIIGSHFVDQLLCRKMRIRRILRFGGGQRFYSKDGSNSAGKNIDTRIIRWEEGAGEYLENFKTASKTTNVDFYF